METIGQLLENSEREHGQLELFDDCDSGYCFT
jgi:hypothetical protein